MMDSELEKARLEEVADWYRNTEGKHAYYIDINYRAIEPYLKGNSCLELGSADGQMTAHLLEKFESVTCVDGSSKYCELVSEKFKGNSNLEVECELFEKYEPRRRFDTIVAIDVLEHLDDPATVLKKSREWLNLNGKLIVLVPNAMSIHRLVGVEMGMLSSPNALNERDQRLGHRRVYDSELLRSHMLAAGWNVEIIGGSMLKPVSDAQMEDWPLEMIDAMLAVGRSHLPEFASTIFAVCF